MSIEGLTDVALAAYGRAAYRWSQRERDERDEPCAVFAMRSAVEAVIEHLKTPGPLVETEGKCCEQANTYACKCNQFAAAQATEPLSDHGRKALARCVEDHERFIKLASDYDLNEQSVQSLRTAIEAMQRWAAAQDAVPVGRVRGIVTVGTGSARHGTFAAIEFTGPSLPYGSPVYAAPAVEAEQLSETDKDVAIAQAVEFAQYVERQAKGTMVDAAKRFLSLRYANSIALRLARAER